MIGKLPRDERISPLRVVAHLDEGLVWKSPPALDGIVAAAYAMRARMIPALSGGRHETIEIPIAKSACGRYHLASFGVFEVEEAEIRYNNKRAPITEYARLCSSSIRRVDISAGADKSFRVPYSYSIIAGDIITWWCLGDMELLEEALFDVHYIGRYRGSGKGRVRRWEVSICDTWEGFPILRDGFPLRNLPTDIPGLSKNASQRFAPVSYPYWDMTKAELLAVPC